MNEDEIVNPLYSIQEIANLLYRMATHYDNREGISTIDRFHTIIHSGDYKYVGIHTGSIGNNNSLDVLIVPHILPVHIEIEYGLGGDALIYVYESPTCTVTGTIQNVINRNRNEVDGSGVSIYVSPTASDVGNLISNFVIYGGTGSKAGGGVVLSANEWILNPNKIYLIRLTNVSGNAARANMRILFYEREV